MAGSKSLRSGTVNRPAGSLQFLDKDPDTDLCKALRAGLSKTTFRSSDRVAPTSGDSHVFDYGCENT